MTFNDRLRTLRNELSLTQKDVAEECDLSPQCISQLEAGTRSPTGTTLVALANCFDCSIDYLMGRTNEPGEGFSFSESQTTLTKTAKELVDIFNKLDFNHQDQILEYARYFATRSGIKIKKN